MTKERPFSATAKIYGTDSTLWIYPQISQIFAEQ
jgi:hypothetical protein